MSPSSEAILHLRGIERSYGGEDVAPALSGLDLSIHEGEFVAIVGASGAGKSTLLNILGLLDTATAGEYQIAGTPVQSLSDRDRDRLRATMFGFIFQDSHMLLKQTTSSNAALGLSINEVAPELRPEIVAEALSAVGLDRKATELARNLSGGERQRAAIARAIATSPRVLLADEPTGSLDTTNSKRVIDTLRQFNCEGVTVVIITHDLEIAETADRIVEISDGRIVSDRASVTIPNESGSQRTPKALAAATQRRWSLVLERLSSALSSHTIHVARAALLLIAFTVGAAGLVSAIGLSQSAAAQVGDRFDSAALDEFLVVPDKDSSAVRAELGLSSDAGVREVAALAAERTTALSGVRSIGLKADTQYDDDVTLLNPSDVSQQTATSPAVKVVDDRYLKARGITTHQGYSYRLFAAESDTPAALIGPDVAERLEITTVAPGSQIWIGTTPVALVGIIDNANGDPELGAGVVANFALAETVEAMDTSYLVGTAPGAPSRIAPVVGVTVAPGDERLFKPEIVADLASLKSGVASDLVSLINIVSWVLLALSSLSAATAAYLSVHARASEIALRRAVGESKRSVWLQFVLEGLVVGLLGGIAGSALGVCAIVLIATMQGWPPTFDFLFVWVGVLTGGTTGVLASLYPAAVAARQDPAIAVRGN